jgi:hypothetical protein
MITMPHILLLLFFSLLLQSIHASAVTIPAGVGSAQDIIDANPAGTTYTVAPGLHQYFSVQPKDNDMYH